MESIYDLDSPTDADWLLDMRVGDEETAKKVEEEKKQDEEIEVKLGKVIVKKPIIHEADGSPNPITPAIARLRNLTYSAPVSLEITIKQASQIESQEVEIGYIPVIVKSNT